MRSVVMQLVNLCEAFGVISNLREADIAEILASGEANVTDAVMRTILCSPLKFIGISLDHSTRPVCLFGCAMCVTLDADGKRRAFGSPWFVATDEIAEYPVAFYRNSRRYIQIMLDKFGYLENFVHADNELSIRWLEWCGFTIDEADSGGFRRFHLIRNSEFGIRN